MTIDTEEADTDFTEGTGAKWVDRLLRNKDASALATAMLRVHTALQGVNMAMHTRALDFQALAREERTAARQAIVKRHQAIHGVRSKVDTSHKVISVSWAGRSTLRIVWTSLWHPKGGNKGQTLPNAIKCREGITDLRTIRVGAHIDEVALLTEHEYKARKLRVLWGKIADVHEDLRHLAEELQRQEAARAPKEDEDA